MDLGGGIGRLGGLVKIITLGTVHHVWYGVVGDEDGGGGGVNLFRHICGSIV